MLSCMVYGATMALFPLLGDDVYYNGIAIYRLLFCLGTTYLTFEIHQFRRNSISAWALKWLCIYLTGFQFVRLTFNWFVTSVITKAEVGVMVIGFIATVLLALKHWKDDHTR